MENGYRTMTPAELVAKWEAVNGRSFATPAETKPEETKKEE